MTNKVTKYGLMTIAAVLLVALAFAGAASADVQVSTLDELNSAISNAPSDDSEVVITITDDIPYSASDAIALITAGKNIILQPNSSKDVKIYKTESNPRYFSGMLTVSGGKLTIRKNGAYNLTLDGNKVGIYTASADPNDENQPLVFVNSSGIFKLEGGNLVDNYRMFRAGGTYYYSGRGGAVIICNGTFEMTGGKLSGNIANNMGGAVYVIPNDGSAPDAKFILKGGLICDNEVPGNNGGAGICLDSGGNGEIYGGIINNNSANARLNQQGIGGGIAVHGSATSLLIEDCIISNNYAASGGANGGGGIYVTAGTVTMNGGHIDNNSGSSTSGVLVKGSSAVFTMNGGTISKNNVTSSGYGYGAVTVSMSGTFVLNNGDVSGNYAYIPGHSQGAIRVYSEEGKGYHSKFIMNGGRIIDNYDSVVGGIDIGGSTSEVSILGGVITNNTGSSVGGILMYNAGRVNVSGSPIISGNFKKVDELKSENNIYYNLGSGSHAVNVIDQMTAGAIVGISTSTTPATDLVAIGAGGYEISPTDLQYFSYDNHSVRALYYDYDSHYIKSGSDVRKITYNANNGSSASDIQYTVANQDTPLKTTVFIFPNWVVKGWTEDSAGTGTVYSDRINIASDVDLYAQWVAKIVLDKNDGVVDGYVNVTYNNASLSDYVAAAKDGYSPEGYYADTTYAHLVINISDSANPKLEKEVAGFTDAKGNWTNTDGSAAKLYANWTVNTTDVTASGNKAEFGNDNVTAIHSISGNITKVLLENVSNVANSAVNFTADNTTVPFNFDGYNKDEISIFEINASAVGTAKINLTVTFKDAETAYAKKDNVSFFHYNVSAWEPLNSTIASQTGAEVLYTVETDSFSPFGIGIFTPITYTVHFNANGGQGSMADMTFTYDQAQNLTANAFQRYNSNFLYWMTDDGTKYYNNAFVQNLTTDDEDTVVMTAQWETYSTGGSSSGTSYLGSNSASYTPTQQPTVKPTVAPTAAPTEKPATPTVIATEKPTTQATQNSPAPFVGLLAGLGAAAILLRMRK